MNKHTHSTSPETNLTTISILQFCAALNGQVITSNGATYDEARAVFNGSIDHQPAVIFRGEKCRV
jgi:hypothetical protein